MAATAPASTGLPDNSARPAVAPSSTAPKRTVVIALDDSKPSAHALEWALDRLLTKDDSIILLNIYEFHQTRPFLAAMELLQSLSTEELNAHLAKEQKRAAIQMMEKYSNTVVERGFVVAELLGIETQEGVKQAIVDYCNRTQPDLLVMASRSLGGVQKFFLGSTSDYCAHHCNCPVVIVKDPDVVAARSSVPANAADERKTE